MCIFFFIFQLSEQLTPYPQPRFYDPVSSRTFDRSHDKRSRGNSKRFHFSKASPEPSADQHQQQYLNHPKIFLVGFLALSIKIINVGSDAFGNPNFSQGLTKLVIILDYKLGQATGPLWDFCAPIYIMLEL